jgi:hypothetical protein
MSVLSNPDEARVSSGKVTEGRCPDGTCTRPASPRNAVS